MAASRWEGDPGRHGGEGGGGRLWTLLSPGSRIQPLPAALEGPSSRHHPRQSHGAPALKHQAPPLVLWGHRLPDPWRHVRAMLWSQPSSVTEPVTFQPDPGGCRCAESASVKQCLPPSLQESGSWTRGTSSVPTVLCPHEDGERLLEAEGLARAGRANPENRNESQVADAGTPLSRKVSM